MHFLVKSSRRTAIGMLMHGVIYHVDKKETKRMETVKKLLEQDPSPIEVLTEKEVAKHRESVVSLMPKAENAPAKPKTVGDFKAALEAVTGERDDLAKQVETLEDEQVKALDVATQVDADHSMALQKAEDLFKDATTAIDGLTEDNAALKAEIERLTADLAEAKAAIEVDQTAKTDETPDTEKAPKK